MLLLVLPKGLKTGMYYLRSRAAADAIKFTVDTSAIKVTTRIVMPIFSFNILFSCISNFDFYWCFRMMRQRWQRMMLQKWRKLFAPLQTVTSVWRVEVKYSIKYRLRNPRNSEALLFVFTHDMLSSIPYMYIYIYWYLVVLVKYVISV